MSEDSCFEVNRVNILGVDVDCVDFAATLDIITSWIECTEAASGISRPAGHQPSTLNQLPTSTVSNSDRPLPIIQYSPSTARQICTVNPEFIIDAQRDSNFARVLAHADLRVADGVGVLWAARLLGVRLRERVTGSDGVYRICERAAKQGWTVFLLGAALGVADRTALILQECYPGLKIVGTYSGNPQDEEWPLIQKRLEETKPDILFVAFGHPQQDLWIAKHRAALPVKVAIGVGGAFDFVAGVLPRAPQWMQRFGLEWLYRLILQPSRIRRMVKIPVFMGLALRQRFFQANESRE